MAAYSSTPLAKKLGYKDGLKVMLVNAPNHYLSLFSDMPENIRFVNDRKQKKDLIHFFIKDAAELERLVALKKEITPNGMIWASWPKKASKMPTDVTEDLIRHTALSVGLVDIKVCAIDDTWSGLKLVIPVKDR